ncbi:MAG: FG-GAP-like repeat-containing protein [Bacteroidia bacterium]
MKKATLLFCLFSGVIAKAQLCLSPATNYTTGSVPYSLICADFNEDGKKDLATANYNSGNASNTSVLLGNGAGSFTATANFNAGSGPSSVSTADFNGDTHLDLAVANYSSNNVSILLGTGTGSFGTATNITVGTAPTCIITTDFNGDGKADLVTSNEGSNNVTILLGNGSGGFSTSNFAAGTGPEGVINADFNGDTKQDIAVVNGTSNNVSILIGNGTGGFGAPTNFAVGNTAWWIVTADFNGDTKADLVTANQGTNNLSVLIGNGAGSFGTATNYTVGTTPYSVNVADFNNDGFIDLLSTNTASNNMSILYGTGSGTFGSANNYAAGNQPSSSVCTDLNGDSKIDIAVTNAGASVYLNGLPTGPITGNMDICSGASTTLYGSSSVSYTWSANAGSSHSSSVFVNPTTTTTYTLVQANSGSGCTATVVATVSVTTTPTVITINGNANICSGNSTVLSASGATTYTWSSNAGNATTSTVSVSPPSSQVFSVIGANGTCVSSGTNSVVVNVTTTPTVGITGILDICSGMSASLYPQMSSTTYSWSTGEQTNAIYPSPTTNTTYTLTQANGTCTASGVATVSVTTTPTVNVTSNADAICFGASATLTAGGASSFTWSPNAGGVISNSVTVNPSANTTYSVTGANGSCTSTQSVAVNVVLPATPDICMVTVDSMSINNIIIWDKTPYNNVDTFFVYRDTANNAYGLIGKVPYDSLSMFTDTVRTKFQANGDPTASSWRYKLAIKDSCGNIGAMSPFHQSIFMQNNTGNFSWTEYKVEGQPLPVPSLNNYLFKRDNNGTGVWNTIQTLSASSIAYTDPQYGTYQSTADWRIETSWTTVCTATLRQSNNGVQGAVVKSRSNVKNNRTTAVKKTENIFKVYPNPANNEVMVHLNKNHADCSIEIINAIGQTIRAEKIEALSTVISVSDLANGIYTLKVKNNEGQYLQKLVVQH